MPEVSNLPLKLLGAKHQKRCDMCHLIFAFQVVYVLIDDKKWPVLHCARGGTNPTASPIALTNHRAS